MKVAVVFIFVALFVAKSMSDILSYEILTRSIFY